MTSYCAMSKGHPVHGPFHDTDHGLPVTDETLLFERLCLEIAQAGLSWETALKRRDGMWAALSHYHIDTIAAYGPDDITRLMQEVRVIRNRLKLEAYVHNARQIQALRAEGGFAAWLGRWASAPDGPKDRIAWVKLFKTQFRFTGGEIVNEFLMGLSILPGAHQADCPVGHSLYTRLEGLLAHDSLLPPWPIRR
jgi:DNA-3-methyladenine glycosylase I